MRWQYLSSMGKFILQMFMPGYQQGLVFLSEPLYASLLTFVYGKRKGSGKMDWQASLRYVTSHVMAYLSL